MRTVFLHLHDSGQANWNNVYFDFERIPVVGEYVGIKSDGDWYKVEMVVHTPFSKGMCAEVYAVKVDSQKEVKKKLDTAKSGVSFQ
ncbi:hypothetical protein [Sporosarcina sp. Te-1]|uniref:hypothetical protein n=1 Tax=Sporosarcina sp. Te-1 TaxID=2818390 RepID=UPI001A9FF193|nr:hypothetical protein [Sporosarcina sp. Te-1]QTD40620.1 hypothetical protein J3U78_17930 [Sporosarcina sp. Te-1]